MASGLNSGPFAPPGTQLAWLQADLAAANANRGVVPFIVAAGHRPWIVLDPADACTACQAAFHNILVQYNVDIALAGHVHRVDSTANHRDCVRDGHADLCADRWLTPCVSVSSTSGHTSWERTA